MTYELNKIVDLITGAYHKPSPAGTHNYLYAKHFDAFGNVHNDYYNTTSKVELKGRNLDHALQDQDLLLVAKGDKNKVCFYKSEIGKAVASSTFIVLRCKKEIVKPKFLFWLLNTSLIQRNLSKLSKGTHVKSISIKVLSKLELTIPSPNDQDPYIALNDLLSRERIIQGELKTLKENYYDNLLINKLEQNEV